MMTNDARGSHVSVRCLSLSKSVRWSLLSRVSPSCVWLPLAGNSITGKFDGTCCTDSRKMTASHELRLGEVVGRVITSRCRAERAPQAGELWATTGSHMVDEEFSRYHQSCGAPILLPSPSPEDTFSYSLLNKNNQKGHDSRSLCVSRVPCPEFFWKPMVTTRIYMFSQNLHGDKVMSFFGTKFAAQPKPHTF